MNGSVAGFLSYAAADNSAAHNRIVRLSELIRDEYALATGTDLTLHASRNDPQWAAEWQDRVANGLDSATFLVPVITPRYFRDPACRQELIDFTTAARAHGAPELVLPIVYTHVRALTDPADRDEAVGLVRRMRYEKWHDLRTDDEATAAHRRAVLRLTARLSAIVDRISLRHNVSGSASGGARALDVIGALADAVPRWSDAFDVLTNALTRIDMLTEKLTLEMASTPFDDGTAVERLAILRTYADEIMKPARDVLTLGDCFAAEVIQLDPGVLALLHDNHATANTEFATHCRSLIHKAVRRSRHTANLLRDHGATTCAITGLTEVLDDPLNDVAAGVRSTLDGITLISEWEQRMTSTGGQTE